MGRTSYGWLAERGEGRRGHDATAGAAGPQGADNQAEQAQQAAGAEGSNTAVLAQVDYEVALKEGAERPHVEMDELRCQGEEQRVGFELQMAGARNVNPARALLVDYEGDIEKVKAAEPWLFGAGAAHGHRPA